MKNLKFLILPVLVVLTFVSPQVVWGMQDTSPTMQFDKGTDETLEAVLGTGNKVILKISLDFNIPKLSFDKEQLEVPARLFLTDFRLCPTDHPAVDFKVKVDCKPTPPTSVLPDKPQAFYSYAEFTDWLNQGYFKNQMMITYDFHLNVQQLAPSLAQLLFAISPGGNQFIGTHIIDNPLIKPDQCVPQIILSSKRGTMNATTATLGGVLCLNNNTYPVDNHHQVFPHPMIDKVIFEKDTTKKFYSHKWLAQFEVTKVTYAEFPSHEIQNWPNAPSGTYSLLRQKLDNLEEIHHLACWDGNSGDEVNISDGRIFSIIREAINEPVEDPQFVESIVKGDGENLYIVRYQYSEAEQQRIKVCQEVERSHKLELEQQEEQRKREAILYRLAFFMSSDGFVDAPNLKEFWVSGSEKFNEIKVQGSLKDQDLYDLTAYATKLTKIDWTHCEGISPIAKEIIRLCWDRSLINLSLCEKEIGDGGAKAIGQALTTNITLTTLDLRNNQIGDRGAKDIGQGLATNTSLTTLDLGNNLIDSEGAKELATSISLAILDLRNNKIGDGGAKAIEQWLATNTTLTRLVLQNNKIGNEGAKAIGQALTTNITLNFLDLYDNQIGSEGAKAIGQGLATNRTLNNLYLGNNQIGDGGTKAIIEGLATNTPLIRLDVVNNLIGSEGGKYIGQWLGTNTTLTFLYLMNNQIGDGGAQAIGQALTTNRTLNFLYLDNNQIGDGGAKAIGQGLATNRTLNNLYLGNNQIGVEGAQAIGKGLETLGSNATLSVLQLYNNQISDEGAQAIGKSLATNISLTTLDLGKNQIGNGGAKAIGQCLATNSSLPYMFLKENNIGDEGAKAIGQCLATRTNTKLVCLYLDNNQIGEATKSTIRNSVNLNLIHF